MPELFSVITKNTTATGAEGSSLQVKNKDEDSDQDKFKVLQRFNVFQILYWLYHLRMIHTRTRTICFKDPRSGLVHLVVPKMEELISRPCNRYLGNAQIDVETSCGVLP